MNEVETEGFGTGLRAQPGVAAGEAPVTTELNAQTQGDTPLVRLDLYASPPPAAA